MRLSPHFALLEFTISEIAERYHVDNEPPLMLYDDLMFTAEQMEKARSILGDTPIVITSGYRCERLNRLVGGSRNSAHMRGLAADFIVPGFGDSYTVATALYAAGWQVDQLIYEYSWVHAGFARATPPRGEVLTFRGGIYTPGIVA